MRQIQKSALTGLNASKPSEKNALELENIRLKEEIKQLKITNQNLRQFSSHLAHDLKSPLRTISGFSHLIEKKYIDTDLAKSKEYLSQIRTGVEHMEEMINGMLDFSTLDGKIPMVGPVDLNEVLVEVTNNLSHAIGEKQAVLLYDDLPTIRTNRTLMNQLFQNLIENAVKYCSAVPPVIEVVVRKTISGYMFMVKDNGEGIDIDKLTDIFMPLYQGTESSEGLGLGLAICQKVVQQHGSRISVDSKKEEGTVFMFELKDLDREVGSIL